MTTQPKQRGVRVFIDSIGRIHEALARGEAYNGYAYLDSDLAALIEEATLEFVRGAITLARKQDEEGKFTFTRVEIELNLGQAARKARQGTL